MKTIKKNEPKRSGEQVVQEKLQAVNQMLKRIDLSKIYEQVER
jgi:hypothetical protein